MFFGKLKQLALIHWFGPKFDRGSQVSVGVSARFGVPSSDVELTLNVVPGILYAFVLMPNVCPRCPVRFTPLCTCVMPETCHPFTKPLANLLRVNRPKL